MTPVRVSRSSRRAECALQPGPCCGHGRHAGGLPALPADHRHHRPRPRPITASAIRSPSRKAKRTVELFIGRSRGSLSPAQQADVARLRACVAARVRPAGIIVDVPAGTANALCGRARPCARSRRSSAPPACRRPAVRVAALSAGRSRRSWPTSSSRYPKMSAPCRAVRDVAGGASARAPHRKYNENGQYYNFGCAHAAQPRRHGGQPGGSGPAARRPRPPTPAGARPCWKKYRKGEPTYTRYEEKDKGKISDVGK